MKSDTKTVPEVTVDRRATYLTTDRRTYAKVRDLKVGECARIEFVNDIVSSTGGKAAEHYTLRRHQLIARMIHGGFHKIMVRCEAGIAVNCIIVGCLSGSEDACSGKVTVRRAA